MHIYHLQSLCDVNSGSGNLQVANMPEIASSKLLMVRVNFQGRPRRMSFPKLFLYSFNKNFAYRGFFAFDLIEVYLAAESPISQ